MHFKSRDPFLWGLCDWGIKQVNILLCCLWETPTREELQLWNRREMLQQASPPHRWAYVHNPVGWYMAGYLPAIKRSNIILGLLIKRSSIKCTLSIEKTHFFEVHATKALNKSTFYCAAFERNNCAAYEKERSCSCGKGGRCYSRPTLLTCLWYCMHRLIFVWCPYRSLIMTYFLWILSKHSVKYYCACHACYLYSENGSQYNCSPTNNSRNMSSFISCFASCRHRYSYYLTVFWSMNDLFLYSDQ